MIRFLSLYIRSIRDYFRDGGTMLAASISFFAMMAMVPLCLFLVSVFGYFIDVNAEFLKYLTDRLSSLFPAITHGITEALKNIIQHKSGVGKLSLALYGLLSYQFYLSIQHAINAVFKAQKKRFFIVSVLISFLVVTLMGSFIMLSFLLASTVAFADVLRDFLPWLRVKAVAGFVVQYILPFLLGTGILMTIYGLLPMKKVRLVHALKGALATSLMLEAAKHVFTWYVGSILRLGTIYGSLSSFVVFMLWIYYSSAIFLIGGELVHNMQEEGRPAVSLNVRRGRRT